MALNMTRRFVVATGAAGRLRDLLDRDGAASSAIAEGRVFVDGSRATDDGMTVLPGSEVVVETARPPVGGARVLDEWRGLYAAFKPAGLSTEPDRRGDASLVAAIATELGVARSELHAVTRLDLPVSGIAVLARGANARQLATSLKDEGRLRRRYVALAKGRALAESGIWDDAVGAHARGQSAPPRTAMTRYRVVRSTSGPDGNTTSLLVLEPATGRTHQLRIHAAGAGAPLLGDRTYGGALRVSDRDGRVLTATRVALHAAKVEVGYADRAEWSVTTDVPADLRALWEHVGGDGGAFETATTVPWLYRA
jgi:23S rRNA pseudouridine955/2504/2580 synthase/23S rRNA pseudouridine1911/1915/1917 synthase